MVSILAEYGRGVNIFIDRWWGYGPPPPKKALLKGAIEVPNTWLSARLRKVAAREAIDMIRTVRERDGKWARKPIHKGKRMYVSSTIASLSPSTARGEFDAWLHVASVGRKISLDLPVRSHRHYHRYASDPSARRLESYIVTADAVQLAFGVEVGEPRRDGPEFGVDTGIHTLAALSDGTLLGTDMKPLVERVKHCQHGSNGQRRARAALHQRMAEVAKEVTSFSPRLVVAEDLTRLSHGTKRDRRLARNMRRSLGAWAYRDWLDRLEQACEMDRVRFERVPPAYTSQRCHVCGHTERGNRKGEVFCCRSCGFAGNADVNAAKNLLIRFRGQELTPTRAYGPGFQPGGVAQMSMP
ncbi:protein containing Transposase, IS605 OrfB, partial [mine drainage metagenome]